MKTSSIYLSAGIWFLLPVVATAQIAPDGSTSTTVETNGNVSTIEAGEQAGGNLFHSFQDFSVTNGSEAYFNNADQIENIFSRVTGGNISNIDGLIRANDANLYLINPAGIIFGENARLDLGGSFYGGTADSILFPDNVEFDANRANAPILTINAPIGLNFRDNPAPVTVNSATLNVASGQSFNLLAGNIELQGATINGVGGAVNLGAVATAGTIELRENLTWDFSGVALADLSLSDGAMVNVNGTGGGSIEVNARNVSFAGGSVFNAGINSADANREPQGGDIVINARENITLTEDSVIRNNVSLGSFGNAGNITLNGQNLALENSSRLSTITFGNGNTGSIVLNLNEAISLSNEAEIKSEIAPEGVGDSNIIQINADSLTLSKNSQLLADVRGRGVGGDIAIATNNLVLNQNSNFSTNLSGEGNAGSISIQARDTVTLEDSTFQTRVLAGGVGNAGNIAIATGSLSLSDSVNNQGSRILASTAGQGNAGNIQLDAQTTIALTDNSSIQTQVQEGGVGNGGNIAITTTDLTLSDGIKASRSSLLANSVGDGNGGNISVDASGTVSLDDFSLILTQGTAGTGDAGDINIAANSLRLDTGSIIISNTGDAENPEIANIGNAGNVEINSPRVILSNFAGIGTSSLNNAEGEAGDITLNVSDRLTIQEGAGVTAITENQADGGTVTVSGGNLDLVTGGKIITLTNGEGNAGNINLNLAEGITIDGVNAPIPTEELRSAIEILRTLEPFTGLFANTTATSSGAGGNIQITTPEAISLFNGGQITVESQGVGNGGNLTVNAGAMELNNQSRIFAVTEAGQPEQQPSNINLEIAKTLSLQGDSQISAQAFNNANGGNVSIDAEFVVAFPGGVEGNDIIANAQEGSGGRIDITAREIFGLAERLSEPQNRTNDLDVSSDFGFDGSVTLETPDVNTSEGINNLPQNAIAAEDNVQQACSSGRINGKSSLQVKGRGGIPQNPTAILSADPILTPNSSTQATIKSSPKPTPILTAQGEIYPARGVLVTKQGEVILTPYAQQETPVSSYQGIDCLGNP